MPDAPLVHRTYSKNERHLQSVRFKKDIFTKQEAHDYCKNRGYYVDGLDETENEYRYRQYDPQYDRFTYFTQDAKEPGVYYIVGTPKN